MAWIMTQNGYYSIVQKPWDIDEHTVTVRARMWDDIDHAYESIPEDARVGKIAEDQMADYRYRFRADKRAVAAWMMDNILDIDYDNFKDRVYDTQGPERARVYARCWTELFNMQLSAMPQRHDWNAAEMVDEIDDVFAYAAPREDEDGQR